ncbi:hypothetical protein B7767_39295, partial [Streptomyces sp. 13-12-16]|uniref:helix-turn-helix transcriptional regulator n=1 Tax=Streptomyces sp. 13-12-16 TaxID=1570823 RepID=UPI000A1DEA56
ARERSAPAGRGRPAWRYRARPPQESPAREYAGLAAVLAARIARTSADPRGDALAAGEDWGRVLTDGQEPSADPREARERLLGLLGEIGFAPEADAEAREVRLPRCPFVETAREHPGVICGVHEGLARAALGALGEDSQEIELLPFAEPGACRLHLDTNPAPDADPAPGAAPVPGAGTPSDAGPAPDAGAPSGAGPVSDSGPVPDAGPVPETGPVSGAGPVPDTGPAPGAAPARQSGVEAGETP